MFFHINCQSLLFRSIIYMYGESGLADEDIVIRIERFPVQTPVGTPPVLGTQTRYEAFGDLWVNYLKM